MLDFLDEIDYPDYITQSDLDRYLSISSGIFLLLLAVSGNFVAETLGCKLQNILTNNMVVKNLVILFMIYFTINITAEKGLNPLFLMKDSIIVWILSHRLLPKLPAFGRGSFLRLGLVRW